MKLSLGARLAGGLLAVGLFATALTADLRPAFADQHGGEPPRASQPGLPDLTVQIRSASCKSGLAEATIVVQNATGVPTFSDVTTMVLVDGRMAFSEDNPHTTKAPFTGSQVYDLSFPLSGGRHTLKVVTDSGNQQQERHETNNTDETTVTC